MARQGAQSREQLLDLFASYFGQAEIRDVADRLQTGRPGGFTTPKTILIVLFASRSGSNYFGQLLCGTGWFNEIGESFAPHQLVRIREQHGLRDVHEAAQWMIDNRGTPAAFGFKAGFHVLAGAAAVGLLPEIIDRAQFVLLRRRDRVAQAVSRVKGKMSGQMHSLQAPGRPLTEADYDADAIEAHLRRTIQADSDLADLARTLGKSAPLFYYEDICADPEAEVRRACGLVGLPVASDYDPSSKVRLSVLRDEVSALWAERFRKERPELVRMAEADQNSV